MATLAARITALAGSIRDKLNTITPRLLPAGGSTGQALVKTSSADNATGWSTIVGATRGFSSYCAGVPNDGEVIAAGQSPYAFNITEANCSAQANVAATASTTFIIKKNTTQIGTIVFAIGATLGTVSITSSAIASGNRITVTGPATADATLAGISILIVE